MSTLPNPAASPLITTPLSEGATALKVPSPLPDSNSDSPPSILPVSGCGLKKFCARARSTFPSPSNSPATTPKPGAICARRGSAAKLNRALAVVDQDAATQLLRLEFAARQRADPASRFRPVPPTRSLCSSGTLVRERGDRVGRAALAANRVAHATLELRLDDVLLPGAVEVAVVEQRGLLGAGVVLRVEAEVRHRVVDVAVAVEVAAGDAVPPAALAPRVQPRGGILQLPCAFRKSATAPHSWVISRSSQPSPSASDHRAPVTMPDCAKVRRFVASANLPCHHCRSRRLAGDVGYCPGMTRPPTNRSMSPSRSKSAAQAAPLLIGLPGNRAVELGEVALAVVEVEPVGVDRVAGRRLDAAAGDEQIEVAVAVGIEKQGRHVFATAVLVGAGPQLALLKLPSPSLKCSWPMNPQLPPR